MSDLQAQLDFLRARMAAVAKRTPPPKKPNEPSLPGRVVQTVAGAHWETERTHQRHGSFVIADLLDMPPDLFDGISEGTIPASPPGSWLFLDTETTGLAGGSGTVAFLIGIGRLTERGFLVRQFFLRDYSDEASALDALAVELASARVLVTYNGKGFDVPLLETRFRMHHRRPPFSAIPHLDLLHGARRLWRLRYASCRLVDLEREVLGFERDGDVPGELIPRLYFDYLRTRSMLRLAAVLEHNAQDIAALACLSGIAPWAFRDPVAAPLSHGAEMISLGRWLRTAGRYEQALTLFRRGIECNIPDGLLFRSLWDIAALEKKLGRMDAALAVYTDLAACRNAHRIAALEELAKHYEHRRRDFTLALEYTETALSFHDTGPLRRRQSRLQRRLLAYRS